MTQEYDVEKTSFLKILALYVLYILSNISLQRVLFIMAFLIFGIGDGISAAMMMEVRGVYSEVNPLMRYFYINEGFGGIVLGKMWLTSLILFAIYIIQINSAKMYWSTNGFLLALIISGFMAMNANLNAFLGEPFQDPREIIFTYLILSMFLGGIGDFIDERS